MLPRTLQALISASLGYKASRCHSFVLQLSQISSYCGLSYLSLLTTYEVETVAGSIFGGSTLVHLVSVNYLKVSTIYITIYFSVNLLNFPEDKDQYMGFLSHVKHGAALSGLCLNNYSVIESMPFLFFLSLSLTHRTLFFFK